MDDELEGIELRYLREKALKSMQRREDDMSSDEPPSDPELELDKLLSESTSTTQAKKHGKSPPKVSSESLPIPKPRQSTRTSRSGSISSQHSTDDRSSSASSQYSSHSSSRTHSTSFSSTGSSRSRSLSYSSSRSSSVTSSSSSVKHRSLPPVSKRHISPAPKYRRRSPSDRYSQRRQEYRDHQHHRGSGSYHHHHRDDTWRSPPPRHQPVPHSSRSEGSSRSQSSRQYRHGHPSRTSDYPPPRRHHEERHYLSGSRHSRNLVDARSPHKYRSVVPSSWQRLHRSPMRSVAKDWRDRRDDRHGSRHNIRHERSPRDSHHPMPRRVSPSIRSRNYRSPRRDMREYHRNDHNRQRIPSRISRGAAASRISAERALSPVHTETRKRKRQRHDSDESVKHETKKSIGGSDNENDLVTDYPADTKTTSSGLDALDEELDYDESMDTIDLQYLQEAEGNDEGVEDVHKPVQSQAKVAKMLSVEEDEEELGEIIDEPESPQSAGKASSPLSPNVDNHPVPVIKSPIRLSPEPQRRLQVPSHHRKSPPSGPASKLHVKERLYLSKTDIERKKQSASHRKEHRLSSKLASRLGPSPASRDRDSAHKRHTKGSALQIAEEYRRQRKKNLVMRTDEREKARRITTYLNEHQSKERTPHVKERKHGHVEESLDRRIDRIKQKNKKIMQRSQEVEEDKHLYG